MPDMNRNGETHATAPRAAEEFALHLEAGFCEDLRGPLVWLLQVSTWHHHARTTGKPTDQLAERVREAARDVGVVFAAWENLFDLEPARLLNAGEDGHGLDLLELTDAARRFTTTGDGEDLEAELATIFGRRFARQE